MTAIVSPVATEPPSETPSSSTVPALGRGDLVLHLHRLDHADQRALLDLCALLDGDLQHRALDRRDELAGRAAAAAALALAARCLPAGRARRRSRRAPRRSPSRRSGGRRPRPRSRARPSPARRRSRRLLGGRERELLEPVLVLDEVAAGLAVAPTARSRAAPGGTGSASSGRRSRTRRARAACAWSTPRGRRPRRSASRSSGRRAAAPRSPPRRRSRRARTGPAGSR